MVVQITINEKKALYKIWYKSKNPDDKINYKKSKRTTIKAVARAKAMAYDDMESHSLKLYEKIIEKKVTRHNPNSRDSVWLYAWKINNLCKQMSEKYRKKNKFLDLERALDRIQRRLIWHKKVPEKYIRIIHDMYKGHTTMVCSTTGTSAGFTIAERIHQGSTLSSHLFITLIDVLEQSIPQTVPWNMIFADIL
ncbi:uncharacterized protein LOC135927098 [Gordionus sp. m RMFG-2023]|uniref:uncharacterized protein LOC135927098 n=1 Tax=Gordionus sp. m RMFG-2023 TaxID=3053472 RepID=UPI0031FD623C